jgi:8-oxo-dGTP pyrophosphatase MutT (NUDIX family)
MGDKIDKNLMHYLVVTGILVKDGKFLIVKRADWEKAFPGRWTVPGGKLEVFDYVLREKDTPHHWYNVFEDLLKREVEEEVGLEFENIGYVTSMVYIRPDRVPCLIVSLYADAKEGEAKLCNALTEYAWVDLKEAKDYDLIEGIYEELEILEGVLKGRGTARCIPKVRSSGAKWEGLKQTK